MTTSIHTCTGLPRAGYRQVNRQVTHLSSSICPQPVLLFTGAAAAAAAAASESESSRPIRLSHTHTAACRLCCYGSEHLAARLRRRDARVYTSKRLHDNIA